MHPDDAPGQDSGPGPSSDLARTPRLDAHGMPAGTVDGGEPDAQSVRERGPSLWAPALVAVAGVALTVLAVVELVQPPPAAGEARPMGPLALAAALALGGFSLARQLQLLGLATSRSRRRAAGAELPEAPWQLTEEHSLHGIWVIGTGASVALMGLLGLWSLWDGRPSGLEPGWPLLLVGALTALVGHLVRVRTTEAWERAGEAP
ncbi:hypothetical protein [Brachybacterium sp.]|uniref:hypothetical protein n=1 Tax=Brachybacterium sp. TaxID=1891286 RepID=UPI002ED19D73